MRSGPISGFAVVLLLLVSAVPGCVSPKPDGETGRTVDSRGTPGVDFSYPHEALAPPRMDAERGFEVLPLAEQPTRQEGSFDVLELTAAQSRAYAQKFWLIGENFQEKGDLIWPYRDGAGSVQKVLEENPKGVRIEVPSDQVPRPSYYAKRGDIEFTMVQRWAGLVDQLLLNCFESGSSAIRRSTTCDPLWEKLNLAAIQTDFVAINRIARQEPEADVEQYFSQSQVFGWDDMWWRAQIDLAMPAKEIHLFVPPSSPNFKAYRAYADGLREYLRLRSLAVIGARIDFNGRHESEAIETFQKQQRKLELVTASAMVFRLGEIAYEAIP